MNRALFLLCIATVTLAIPLGDRELQKRDVTPEKFTKIARALVAYKQYVPSDLMEELEDILKPENSDEIEELIDFATKLRSKTSTPEMGEIGKLMKKDSPKIFTRFARIFTSTVMRIMSLSEPAQKFFMDLKPEEAKSGADNIRFIAAMKKKFDTLPANVQAEYVEQFPELMKFFATPAYQSFINSLIEYSAGSDETVIRGGTLALTKMMVDFMQQ